MKVRGAYMTVKEFLNTYRQGIVYTEQGNNATDSWHLEAERILIIPDYQREYRWGEKQLTELVNDISSGNCYLGQIAVSRNSNEPQNYYLVDGQQRITSLIILLTVLCRQFHINNDSLNFKHFELHQANNNEENPLLSRLSFKANCFPHFQAFISQIYNLQTNDEDIFNCSDFNLTPHDSYMQRERYIDACSSLNVIICKHASLHTLVPDKLRYIKEIIQKILKTQVSVVVFDGESSYESEKVFLDINEKGLRLDNEDILKAYYFQSISSDKGKEALESWTSLKTAYFSIHDTLKTEKMPLETYVNYALQTELLMQNNGWVYSKFDDDLRYKDQDGKRHICQLLTDTRLHESIQLVSNFLNDINTLLENDPHSTFYKDYLNGRDSTTREVFKLLFNSICRSEMKIIFIALIKIWWLRKSIGEKIRLEDIYQLFSFYVVSNISGLKKEKILFTNEFISANSIIDMYTSLYFIEKQMLEEAYSKATTLKSDQEKGECLSFNIQMFYNDFLFNKTSNQWGPSLTNQEFLAKYSANRYKYVKDHFLIQNGRTIRLFDGTDFSVPQRMVLLRKRAYNFIYHEDNFGNVDFVTRLNTIFCEQTDENGNNPKYGRYENDFFRFIKEHMQSFYKQDTDLPTWEIAIEKYKLELPRVFPQITSYILEENISTWNRRVCKYFEDQLSHLVNQAAAQN